MVKDLKFVAELSNVIEISLKGKANLKYWQERLHPYGLSPLPLDGSAQIFVTSAKSRFRGIAFGEISFGVMLSPFHDSHQLPEAACLLRAFNSNRFFAFCERTFFSTPYNSANCEISLDPVKIGVEKQNKTLFSAQMGSLGDRQTEQLDDDGWYGTIAIPPKKPGNSKYKYFVAKITGKTTIYEFDESNDTLIIEKDSGVAELSQIVDSGFKISQWIIRKKANHSKSKTYTSSTN